MLSDFISRFVSNIIVTDLLVRYPKMSDYYKFPNISFKDCSEIESSEDCGTTRRLYLLWYRTYVILISG